MSLFLASTLASLLCAQIGGEYQARTLAVGQEDQQFLGEQLCTLGDLDGDGVRELLFGSPSATVGGLSQVGEVRVFSGKDGRLLWRLTGLRADAHFGQAVAAAEDFDGDGVEDFLLAYSDLTLSVQIIQVRSGRTGALVLSLTHPSTSSLRDNLALACPGDMDGDGLPEVAVGDRLESGGPFADSGSVTLYSGTNGQVLSRIWGSSADGEFGASFALPGDLNGDGKANLIVGAPGDGFGSGRCFAYNGLGQLLYVISSGAGSSGRFGEAMTTLDDLDGDGVRDYAVGLPEIQGAGGVTGMVSVRSGANGHERYSHQGSGPNEFFGRTLATVGDVDGDGFSDFAVGAPAVGPFSVGIGRVRLLSADTGVELRLFVGNLSSERFGGQLAGPFDRDLDGHPDMLIASTRASRALATEAGRVDLYEYDPQLRATVTSLSLGAGGQAAMSLDFGAAYAGRRYLMLSSAAGPGESNYHGVRLPLAPDHYLLHSLQGHFPAPLVQPMGLLDADGKAHAGLLLAPGSPSAFIGTTFRFAAVAFGPEFAVSAPVAIELLP